MHKKTIHKHFLNNHVKRVVHQQIKWFHCKLVDLEVLLIFFFFLLFFRYEICLISIRFYAILVPLEQTVGRS